MDIDMSALRGLEREKDISFDLVVKAIEDALLIAYHRTEGAAPKARVELDRKTRPRDRLGGRARRRDGEVLREFDDTPSGFGRIAATTAKQVILQRLRDAEEEITFGEYAGREGDWSPASSSRAGTRRSVLVDIGKTRGDPAAAGAGARARSTRTAPVRCLRRAGRRKGPRARSVTLSRTHPNLVKKLFALEVPEIADGTVEIAAIAREAGHRTKIAVRSTPAGGERQGRVHRPDGRAGCAT